MLDATGIIHGVLVQVSVHGTDNRLMIDALSLVRDGAWVKLSGANRLAPEPWQTTDPLARALREAAPDRCVWGSDWPNFSHWDRMINLGELLDLLADWVPDPASRDRVLVDSGHRLYGFRGAIE